MQEHEGYTNAEKIIKLPRETQDGIHITGMETFTFISSLLCTYSVYFSRIPLAKEKPCIVPQNLVIL